MILNYSTEKHLNCHYGSKHEDLKKIICQYCQEGFGTTKKIKSHILKSHKNSTEYFNKYISSEQSKIQCEKCKKYFFKNDLDKHMKKMHSVGVKCQCEKCGLDFENRKKLSEHLGLVHREEMKEACHICGKLYNPYRLTAHMKYVHEKIREIICPHCGKDYIDNATLKRHIKHVHEGLKPACPQCGKTYFRPEALKDHIVHETILFLMKSNMFS